MKTKIIFGLMCISLVFIVTCRHLPNDVPTPSIPTSNGNGNGGGNGNIKDSVCFSEEILPLLISNCAKSGCHDANTAREGVVLNSYTNVINTISGKKLMKVIQASGSDLMPPSSSGPALTPAQIGLIQQWVDQGRKNGIDCQCNIDTNNVTFSTTIFPMIQSNCLGCHNSTAPILTNYTYIKAQVDNGKIYKSMNHLAGAVAMPLNGPQLSSCKLTAFNKWVHAGAPNN